jgi:DHA1 family tetracycline resistance protein-like MFS transporter
LTTNLPLLFVARALDGVTGGNISVAQSAIADVSTPETKTRNFGIIGMAFGLGFVLGPYIGARLANYQVFGFDGIVTPLIFATILCLLNVLSVFFIFPETIKKVSNSVKIDFFSSFKNIKKAFAVKNLTIISYCWIFVQFRIQFFHKFLE